MSFKFDLYVPTRMFNINKLKNCNYYRFNGSNFNYWCTIIIQTIIKLDSDLVYKHAVSKHDNLKHCIKNAEGTLAMN